MTREEFYKEYPEFNHIGSPTSIFEKIIVNDFESRTCEDCSLLDGCEATLGLSKLYPSHTYIKEIVGGYCMNFERKQNEN